MSRDKLVLKLRELRAVAEECLELLASETDSRPVEGCATRAAEQGEPIDFGKPIRPFMKTYSKNLSGSKKFVLLLAWLATGDPKKQIALSEIKKHWRQMVGILGVDFNLFFTGNAKDRDWVETKAKGLYSLRPSWKEILQKSE